MPLHENVKLQFIQKDIWLVQKYIHIHKHNIYIYTYISWYEIPEGIRFLELMQKNLIHSLQSA